MSDLRTRVIYVLHDSGDMPASKAARLADAVILELGLDTEWGCPTAGHNGCRCSSRHVTKWETEVVKYRPCPCEECQ